MKIDKAAKKDLYYTKEHEWIDFQGTIAYVGICPFKLTGFKDIHGISLAEPPVFLKQGEKIASITYADYQVEVLMPVAGKIQQINEALFTNDKDIVLKQSEGAGWIALIIPSMPYERKGLLLPKEYQLNNKNKYAK